MVSSSSMGPNTHEQTKAFLVAHWGERKEVAKITRSATATFDKWHHVTCHPKTTVPKFCLLVCFFYVCLCHPSVADTKPARSFGSVDLVKSTR